MYGGGHELTPEAGFSKDGERDSEGPARDQAGLVRVG